MADIEKSLPNEANPFPEEEIQEEIEVMEPGETEVSEETDIVENEDGSVDIDFDPTAMAAGESQDHYANLAEFIEDNDLSRMGTELYQNYQEYKSSRKDWENAYRQGLDLLGFKYEQRTEPFQGASGATHPVLA